MTKTKSRQPDPALVRRADRWANRYLPDVRPSFRACVGEFLEWAADRGVDPRAVTPDEISAYREEMVERHGLREGPGRLAPVRAFLDWAS